MPRAVRWRAALAAAVSLWVLAAADARSQDAAPARADTAVGLPVAGPLVCLDAGDPARRPRYRAADALVHGEFTVRLELRFVAAHAAPEVAVLFSNADRALLDDVVAYVQRYRLPCLPDGAAPVAARQEFDFVEDDRRTIWSAVRSADDPPDYSGCLRDGSTPESRDAAYPLIGSVQGRGGAVLALLTFTDRDQPPRVKPLYVAGGSRYADAAAAVAAAYRLPCLPAGATFVVRQLFDFWPTSGKRYAFKPMKLVTFLSMVEGIHVYRRRFDFGTMGCPFDLRMEWYRPYAPNHVGQLGTDDPNRREFLAWLSELTLSMPDDRKQQLLGQPFTLTVPCGTLDLTS